MKKAEPQPEIIFEDAHLIVLSKPAGLLSQGEHKNEPNLVDWLRGYLGRNYVGLIHRLDRNTSGIMVAAKRTKAASRLTESLQKGEMIRIYLAWLTGELKNSERWTHWLVKDSASNQVRAVPENISGAKEAVLNVEPLRGGSWKGIRLTLVQFKLETGRSHQIRVQASEKGYPLLGDLKYGKFKRDTAANSFGRPALHSWRLEFPHPMSGELLRFEVPLPDDFKEVENGSA